MESSSSHRRWRAWRRWGRMHSLRWASRPQSHCFAASGALHARGRRGVWSERTACEIVRNRSEERGGSAASGNLTRGHGRRGIQVGRSKAEFYANVKAYRFNII